jgi:hydrogenase maturation protease
MRPDTLLLGLGNEALRDDGVGLAAVRRVASRLGSRVAVNEACVATLDLLLLVSGYRRLIVLDAWISETDPPGTPVRASPRHLPPGFGARSFHTFPFRDLLHLGRILGYPMPDEVVIHGLAVADTTTFGASFTPAVERAWRPWADRVAGEIAATIPVATA